MGDSLPEPVYLRSGFTPSRRLLGRAGWHNGQVWPAWPRGCLAPRCFCSLSSRPHQLGTIVEAGSLIYRSRVPWCRMSKLPVVTEALSSHGACACSPPLADLLSQPAVAGCLSGGWCSSSCHCQAHYLLGLKDSGLGFFGMLLLPNLCHSPCDPRNQV